jgi:CDP-glycerol glycerophosphotransferase (TagB/SpsB family)
MDPLFWPQRLPLPFALAPGKRVVLYAPTFQASLSSARLLGERTVALLRGQRKHMSIIIKPHPLIGNLFPQWMQQWQRLAAEEPDVHLVQDTHSDVMPFLKAADVLVTDLSSVALEFLALKRPMVLVTSPHRNEETYVDPNGLEWRWRDMGHEIFDVEQLPAAVSYALDNPGVGLNRRQHYHDLLFGELADGQAAKRIADSIAALADDTTSDWRMSLGSRMGTLAVRATSWKERVQAWRAPLKFQAKTSAP